MDESVNKLDQISSLFALEVDSKIINEVIEGYYKILRKIIDRTPKEGDAIVIYPTPFLHGSQFLRNSPSRKPNEGFDFSYVDDSLRIEILRDIVNLVNKHSLKFYSSGHIEIRNIVELMKGEDEKLYTLNFRNLLDLIDEHKSGFDEYIFVMDGTNDKMMNKISSYIANQKSFCFLYGMEKEMPELKRVKNYLNNVYYSPSKYCEMLQVADVIGYLKHKSIKNSNYSSSEYTQLLKTVYSELRSDLIIERLKKINKVEL